VARCPTQLLAFADDVSSELLMSARGTSRLLPPMHKWVEFASATGAMAHQITEAFPWNSAPKYLIRDSDRAFGIAFKARVRAIGIRDRPTPFRSSWQNCFAERLIGSIRRECTDHLIVFNAEHLRRILAKYTSYCSRPAVYFDTLMGSLPIRGWWPQSSDYPTTQ
jgi:hypothetical protein